MTNNTIVLHQNVIRNKREETLICKVSEEISLVTALVNDALSHSPPTRPGTRSLALLHVA